MVVFYAETPLGTVCDLFTIYPETENTTHTFIPVFRNKSLGIFNFMVDKQLLNAINQVIGQDAVTIENLYPRFEPKIRLPNEEPWNWARQLYLNWSVAEGVNESIAAG